MAVIFEGELIWGGWALPAPRRQVHKPPLTDELVAQYWAWVARCSNTAYDTFRGILEFHGYDRDDLVIHAWERITWLYPRWRPSRGMNFKTFTCMVTNQAAFKLARSLSRKKRMFELTPEQTGLPESEELVDEDSEEHEPGREAPPVQRYAIESHVPCIEDELIEGLKEGLSRQAFERLHPVLQKIVKLTILEGRTNREAAIALGAPEEMVPWMARQVTDLKARAIAAMRFLVSQQLGEREDGIPIEQLPGLTSKLVLALHAAGIHSVRELVAVERGTLSRIPKVGMDGLRKLDRVRRILEGEELKWAV